jgi:hypothetical protein
MCVRLPPSTHCNVLKGRGHVWLFMISKKKVEKREPTLQSRETEILPLDGPGLESQFYNVLFCDLWKVSILLGL